MRGCAGLGLETVYVRAAASCRPDPTTNRAPLVLDVGGKLGWYALVLAGAGCRVEVFASQPYDYNTLRYALVLNPALQCRVHVNNVRAGSSPGEHMVRHVKKDTRSPFASDDHHELQNGSRVPNIAEIAIRADRLDTLVTMSGELAAGESVALLRVDAEAVGSGLHALQGAERLLTGKRVQCLAMEISAATLSRDDAVAVRDLLKRTGYVVANVGFEPKFEWGAVLASWKGTVRRGVFFKPSDKAGGCGMATSRRQTASTLVATCVAIVPGSGETTITAKAVLATAKVLPTVVAAANTAATNKAALATMPDLELVIPVHSKGERTLKFWFMETLNLFWHLGPARVVMLVDDLPRERKWAGGLDLKGFKNTKTTVQTMSTCCNGSAVGTDATAFTACLPGKGHDVQQYYQMIADTVTSSEFAAG